MYYPSSENKGADQLRSYREADLRLCFRICRLWFSHKVAQIMWCEFISFFFFLTYILYKSDDIIPTTYPYFHNIKVHNMQVQFSLFSLFSVFSIDRQIGN